MSENNFKFKSVLKKLGNCLGNILKNSMNYWNGELSKNSNKVEKYKKRENTSVKSWTHFYAMEEGDLEKIQIIRQNLKNLSPSQLIESLNHLLEEERNDEQVLEFIAHHQEFYARFKKSPFDVEGSHLIQLKGKVKYLKEEDTFIFLEDA